MPHYFISDLHLSPARMDVLKAYYNFCDTHLHSGDSLTILGDFFDAWIGDDEDQPFYLQVLAQLASLSKKNINLSFMRGNRDFLIGERFAQATGATLLIDPTLVAFASTPCVLLHGDSLCTSDTEYMAFRKQVRGNAWQQQILSMPLAQRRELAADLRAKSKSMNSNKADDIMDVTQAAVDEVFEQTHTRVMIHGHTHRPARHTHSVNGVLCERIVLGDWHTHGWYLKVDENFELVQFDLV